VVYRDKWSHSTPNVTSLLVNGCPACTVSHAHTLLQPVPRSPLNMYTSSQTSPQDHLQLPCAFPPSPQTQHALSCPRDSSPSSPVAVQSIKLLFHRYTAPHASSPLHYLVRQELLRSTEPETRTIRKESDPYQLLPNARHNALHNGTATEVAEFPIHHQLVPRSTEEIERVQTPF
jgi:hypothetical protein